MFCNKCGLLKDFCECKKPKKRKIKIPDKCLKCSSVCHQCGGCTIGSSTMKCNCDTPILTQDLGKAVRERFHREYTIVY